jgi:enoyl-[acyl-carrier-protein] reductase (NADH)
VYLQLYPQNLNQLDWKPNDPEFRFDEGQAGLILGVANNRSIAWGIARACHAARAEIALTWQGDALKKRVEPLAGELDGLSSDIATC